MYYPVQGCVCGILPDWPGLCTQSCHVTADKGGRGVRVFYTATFTYLLGIYRDKTMADKYMSTHYDVTQNNPFIDCKYEPIN